MNDIPEREHLIRLRHILIRHFNQGELRTLCFDLGVDYDDLPGGGKADKARELVAYLERHSRIPQLVEVGQRQRPDISWKDTLFGRVPDDEVWVTTREAMGLTGYGPGFLRELAREQYVRAHKEGRIWLFDREAVRIHSQGWIGTREASAVTGYSVEYLRWLAREGPVIACKVSGIWFLHRGSLLEYCQLHGRTVG